MKSTDEMEFLEEGFNDSEYEDDEDIIDEIDVDSSESEYEEDADYINFYDEEDD